ncbi:MAG: ribosomal protein S18-alanine N-acetyltransferase [Anaerolineae bacterium]|nr:ribosomal protein S18-alanine N-acetyltransferase [Anaerolineae bacterium]
MSDTSKPCALPVVVVPLSLDDLDDLMSLEKASFSLPWPRGAYRYELTRNPYGHYLALHPAASFRRRPGMKQGLPPLLGYGGFWLLADEAHICTIASHPDYRGHGLGEWMLLHLMRLARDLKADVVTLEVRVSNKVAQRLYQRTGFRLAGRRHRYYHDTGEDALIMTTPPLSSPEMMALLAQRWEIVRSRLCEWAQEIMRQEREGS